MTSTPADGYRLSGIPDEDTERLLRFQDLLRRWNNTINLVSFADLEKLWNRHIADSAQLLSLAPERFDSWVDLGSGGGFPGLVIAILCRSSISTPHFTLVESDQRKSAFLRQMCREFRLNCDVVVGRAEVIEGLGAGVLSARALAPLSVLLGLAVRHLGSGGIGLFPKGVRWRSEVDEARTRWRFDLDVQTNSVNPEGVILRIGNVQHA